MKRGFLTVLPEGEVERRRQGLLALGISKHAVNALHKRYKKLCDHEKARARIDNLARIGFPDPISIVESQPHILLRTEEDVCTKIEVWKKWCHTIDRNVSIYEICRCRPQIFSAMSQKVHVVFLVAQHTTESTIQRICNMVTLNIENVLIMFARYRKASFVELHQYARKCTVISRATSVEKRVQIISSVKKLLPRDVYVAYMQMMM